MSTATYNLPTALFNLLRCPTLLLCDLVFPTAANSNYVIATVILLSCPTLLLCVTIFNSYLLSTNMLLLLCYCELPKKCLLS